MIFQYLGTAAAEGIPALFCQCDVCAAAAKSGGRNIRGRSGAIVNDTVLIDFPPDMWMNKIRFGLDLASVTDVFFTHAHIDHLAAAELCYFDEMYATRTNRGARLLMHGNEKVLRVIRDMLLFDMGRVPEWAQLCPLEAFVPVRAGSVTLTPLPARHDAREACLLFLVEEDQGARMLLANDTAMLPEETFAFLKGLYLAAVSLDCTAGKYPCAQSHMGFPDNLAVQKLLTAQGSADAGTRFISHHFSHNGHINYDDFALFAGDSGFVSSYDGMRFAVGAG